MIPVKKPSAKRNKALRKVKSQPAPGNIKQFRIIRVQTRTVRTSTSIMAKLWFLHKQSNIPVKSLEHDQ